MIDLISYSKYIAFHSVSRISNPKTCPLGFRICTTQPFNIRPRICYNIQEKFILISAVCHYKLKNVLSSFLILVKKKHEKHLPLSLSYQRYSFLLLSALGSFQVKEKPWSVIGIQQHNTPGLLCHLGANILVCCHQSHMIYVKLTHRKIDRYR